MGKAAAASGDQPPRRRSGRRHLPRAQLVPGPLQRLKDQLYALYEQAGRPTLDTLTAEVAAAADELDLAGVPGRDTIRRYISDATRPHSPDDLEALATVLARLARVDAAAVVAQARKHWADAGVAQVYLPSTAPIKCDELADDGAMRSSSRTTPEFQDAAGTSITKGRKGPLISFGVLLIALTVAIVTVVRGGADHSGPVFDPPTPRYIPTMLPDGSTGLIKLDFESDIVQSRDARIAISVVDQYFTAVNTKDYALWISTVDEDLLPPGRNSSAAVAASVQQDWLNRYSSTRNTSIVIHSLKQRGSSFDLTLSWTSTQDISAAPRNIPIARLCWSSYWTLRQVSIDAENPKYVIGAPGAGRTSAKGC